MNLIPPVLIHLFLVVALLIFVAGSSIVIWSLRPHKAVKTLPSPTHVERQKYEIAQLEKEVFGKVALVQQIVEDSRPKIVREVMEDSEDETLTGNPNDTRVMKSITKKVEKVVRRAEEASHGEE